MHSFDSLIALHDCLIRTTYLKAESPIISIGKGKFVLLSTKGTDTFAFHD